MQAKTPTVLLVDDDPRNRRLLETLLQADGYAVISAENGTAALQSLFNQAPDLVLLDLMMPDLDGFDVLRRLRAHPEFRTLPIVIVTALDDPGSDARLAAAGVDAVLRKPIDRWAVKAALKRFLGPVTESPA